MRCQGQNGISQTPEQCQLHRNERKDCCATNKHSLSDAPHGKVSPEWGRLAVSVWAPHVFQFRLRAKRQK